MNQLPFLTAMLRPRKARFGYKAYIHVETLFPITSWLRDNLPPYGRDTWWFTLEGVSQMNIYTNDPVIASHLTPLTEQ